MKDSITHAILVTGLLEIDLVRISASGNEEQQGLAADCADHRLQLANKLRHIANMEDIATVIESERSHKATIIPSTPEQSAELHKLAEPSIKIEDFFTERVNVVFERSRKRELDGKFDAEILEKELFEQSFKAGDFNGDEFRDIEQCNRELKSPERREFDEINPVSDKAYRADLIRRENVELWRNYDRKKNWLGWGLAAIAAGAILAGIKIWVTYF